MTLPADIQQFMDAHHPCGEGKDALRHGVTLPDPPVSMEAGWDTAKNGRWLTYIAVREGGNTPELEAVRKQFGDPQRAAHRALKKAQRSGADKATIDAREAELDAVLSDYADAIRVAVPNPFA